jgi:putative transposase
MEEQRARTAFTYKLMPTLEQARTLATVLWRCRELYNAGLEERKTAWEMCRVSVSFAMQLAQLPAIKAVRPEYHKIHA